MQKTEPKKSEFCKINLYQIVIQVEKNYETKFVKKEVYITFLFFLKEGKF